MNCRFCGKLARESSTVSPPPEECTNCWEVLTRIRHMPTDVLNKILNERMFGR